MPDPLLTRADALRSYLRAQYDAAGDISDPDIRAAAREALSEHMAFVDDVSERLQVDDR